MKETQASIVKWADETFGPIADEETAAKRMFDEVFEMEDDYFEDQYDKVAKEFIDVFVTGVRFLAMKGIDFQEALDAKMAINRARKWRSNGDGTGQHIKEEKP